MDVELTPNDSDVSVTVSTERISKEVGDQGILGDNVGNREFFYLAALALETEPDDTYSIERTLIEFVRNTSSISLEDSEYDKIEEVLR